jgi:hypothetical protein
VVHPEDQKIALEAAAAVFLALEKAIVLEDTSSGLDRGLTN